MNPVIKSVFVTLLLTMALNFSFGQHTITILHGNPSDGTLELSDGGFSTVIQGTRINWVIDPSSNVASIDEIHSKRTFPIVFIGAPTRSGKNWTGKTIFSTKKNYYEYYITWTEKVTGLSHTYDPKIAVNPSFYFIVFFILGGLSIIGIPTLMYFRRRKKRKIVLP